MEKQTVYRIGSRNWRQLFEYLTKKNYQFSNEGILDRNSPHEVIAPATYEAFCTEITTSNKDLEKLVSGFMRRRGLQRNIYHRKIRQTS